MHFVLLSWCVAACWCCALALASVQCVALARHFVWCQIYYPNVCLHSVLYILMVAVSYFFFLLLFLSRVSAVCSANNRTIVCFICCRWQKIHYHSDACHIFELFCCCCLCPYKRIDTFANAVHISCHLLLCSHWNPRCVVKTELCFSVD